MTQWTSWSWARQGIVAIFVAGLFSIVAPSIADNDLWGHLRFGQDILTARGLPDHDPYSYLTQGQRWINHEWLAEVTFALVYRTGGGAGLVIVKTLLAMGLLLLVYRDWLAAGVEPLPAGTLTMITAGLMAPGVRTVRPQIFTYVLLGLTLRLLREAEARSTRLWALVPIFLLWVQCHGGVLAGLGVVALWVLGHLCDCARAGERKSGAVMPGHAPGRDDPRAGADLVERPMELCVAQPRGTVSPRASIGILACCVLACMLNPYGPSLLGFLLRTATVPRPEITEWQPVAIASSDGVLYLIAIVLMIGAVSRDGMPRPTGMLAIIAALAILPLTAMRHLPLLGIGLGIAARDPMASWVASWGNWGDWPRSRWARAFFVALAVLAAGRSARDLAGIRVDPKAYPARAVELLGRLGASGPAIVQFDWGEYVIWYLGPQVQVAMDGRRETIYSDALRHESFDFLYGRGQWDRLLLRHHVGLVLLPVGIPCTNLMRLHPGWTVLFEDPVAVVFVPVDSPWLRSPLPQIPRIAQEGEGPLFPAFPPAQSP